MTVTIWGHGKPDYMKVVIPSPAVIVDTELMQVNMITHKDYSILAGAVAIDSFYTVLKGYKLALGEGYISVKDSCINKLRLITPDEGDLIGNFRYNMQGDIKMTAGQEIKAGTTITAYIYNLDTIPSEFSLQLAGVLTKV